MNNEPLEPSRQGFFLRVECFAISKRKPDCFFYCQMVPRRRYGSHVPPSDFVQPRKMADHQLLELQDIPFVV